MLVAVVELHYHLLYPCEGVRKVMTRFYSSNVCGNMVQQLHKAQSEHWHKCKHFNETTIVLHYTHHNYYSSGKGDNFV